jgi:hypothetical protein
MIGYRTNDATGHIFITKGGYGHVVSSNYANIEIISIIGFVKYLIPNW